MRQWFPSPGRRRHPRWPIRLHASPAAAIAAGVLAALLPSATGTGTGSGGFDVAPATMHDDGGLQAIASPTAFAPARRGRVAATATEGGGVRDRVPGLGGKGVDVTAPASGTLSTPDLLPAWLRARLSASRAVLAGVRVQAIRLMVAGGAVPAAARDDTGVSAGPGADAGAPDAQSSSRPELVRLNVDLSGVNRSSAAYARFRTWVDNAVNGAPGYDFHPGDAAIMFLITREVKYCTLGVRLVEAQVAAAEARIAAGGVPEIAGDSYLEVGPMLSDLSLVYQACQAQASASQRRRWADYAEQAVWNVWHHEDARWGGRAAPWSGWSVDNPGNNYHYSFLEATMSWALASGSTAWHDFLERDKLPKLQAYYAANPGGGSLEGTGYGTAQKRLFDLYALWRRSTGRDASAGNPHARNSIDYWVHATVPTLDRFAPIGDQSRNSVPELYDYQRHLMLSARNLTLDPAGRGIASWWLGGISVKQMGQGANLRYDALLPAGSGGAAPTALYYAARGTGHVFARTGWDASAMWMAFVAGPYNESHAHQDQGGFTLFSRGDWLAVTENIWSRSGIQQGTEVHNVVRFERSDTSPAQCGSPAGDRIVHQCEPTTSTATVAPGANGALTIDADLTPAYRGNAALRRWTRRIEFAGRRLTVLDNFSLGSGTTAHFQLNVPVQPTVVDARTVTAGRLRVRVLQPSGARIGLHDWNRADGGEFARGWRIDVSGGTSVYQVELSEL